MSEYENLRGGKLFDPSDPVLKEIKLRAHLLSQDYNRLQETEAEKRSTILQKLLSHIGKNTFLQGPIIFHYGVHTEIGNNCFVNFNFTVQDDAPVRIGDCCNFGPNVTIVTPLHPMLAEERNALKYTDGTVHRLCYAKPVSIGSNCWFGANVVVCPGVTIGENCVIGAGSVVTHDIPVGAFAAGNPCRVIRMLSENDSVFNLPNILSTDMQTSGNLIKTNDSAGKAL